MKTVLGLSVTAAGVGWVLVEATAPVDDDKFVVHGLGDIVPRCLAAVRGAQSIAASSGRRIDSIGVCWSQDVEDQVIALLAALRTAGWPDVRSVRQVTPLQSDLPPVQRTERTDLCGLLAGLLARDDDTDADDETAFAEHDMICGPDAGRTPAYDAARAVITDAAPAETVLAARARRNWVPEWTPALSGARLVSAAAVTAVVALFAVGSQFVGTEKLPTEAALAGSASAPTAQTTQVVPQQPPTAQPMAAAPEPAPAPAEVSEPPVQPELPQPQPVAAQSVPVEPAVPAESPVIAEPLAAPQLPALDAAPDPVAPLAVPEPAAPAAAPVAPPEALPPAPVVPPPPFWLAPPFVPAPLPPPPAAVAPAPEALAAPVEHLPPPAPVPPVDPVLGALP